jgi:hypothetical protein
MGLYAIMAAAYVVGDAILDHMIYHSTIIRNVQLLLLSSDLFT